MKFRISKMNNFEFNDNRSFFFSTLKIKLREVFTSLINLLFNSFFFFYLVALITFLIIFIIFFFFFLISFKSIDHFFDLIKLRKFIRFDFLNSDFNDFDRFLKTSSITIFIFEFEKILSFIFMLFSNSFENKSYFNVFSLFYSILIDFR